MENNGWIKTNERMPETGKEVIVTICWGDIALMSYDENDNKWYTSEESVMYDPDEIVAWREAPKPYVGDNA